MKKNLFQLGFLTLTGFMALSAGHLTAAAAFSEDIWEYTETIDEENVNILFEFKELELAVPSDWEDKYVIETSDAEVTFYHKASREACLSEGWTGGGRMFSVCCSEALDFLSNPSYQIVGSGEEGIYYLTFPSDAQGYYKDETIYNEWLDMLPGVDLVRSSVELTVTGEAAADTFDYADDDYTPENPDETFHEDEDSEYIVEDSSIRYLSAGELSHLNAEELQMAINEIYARHHRKFLTKSIQEYFDSKSWYTGTVEAAKFDETSLNQYEGKNIALMIQCMNSAPQNSGSSILQASNGSSSDAPTSTDSAGNSGFTGSTGFSATLDSGSTAYATTDVNIRANASINSAIMGCVQKGRSVTVTGSTYNNEWVPVNFNGIRGYIFREYLSASQSSASVSASAAEDDSPSLLPTAETLTPDASAQTEDFPWNSTGKLTGTIDSSDGKTLQLLSEDGSLYHLAIGWWTSILYDYRVGDLVQISYAGYPDEELRLLTMFQHTEPSPEEQQLQTISGTIKDTYNDFIVLNTDNGNTYSFYAVPGASGFSSGEYVTISYYGSLESPEAISIE